jgi:hypothetical protein
VTILGLTINRINKAYHTHAQFWLEIDRWIAGSVADSRCLSPSKAALPWEVPSFARPAP